MIRYVNKVLAYLTRGSDLLLFTHTAFPAAGIQVPAGTVEPGETPLQAVVREVREETGLTSFHVERLLGIVEGRFRDAGRVRFSRRYFYHARVTAAAPERWLHWERHPSGGGAFEFAYFWAPLPDGVPPLAGKQDALLRLLSPTPP